MSMNSPVLFFKQGTCSLGSVITAEWSGIPYRLCRITDESINSPDYLCINALGEVPALQADDIFLSESIAILQSLGKQAPSRNLTFAQDTLEFDKMNQVLSYLATSFKGSFHPLFEDVDITWERKQKVIENIRSQFQYVERYLVGEGMIFGQKTIADAYFFGLARWGEDLFNIKKEFPCIAAFQEEMLQDRGVHFALAMEEGKPAISMGQFQGMVQLKSPEAHLGADFPGLQINRKTGQNEDLIAS